MYENKGKPKNCTPRISAFYNETHQSLANQTESVRPFGQKEHELIVKSGRRDLPHALPKGRGGDLDLYLPVLTPA